MNIKSDSVIYGIEDVPRWYLCLLFGFQHYLTMFSSTIAYPLMLAPKLCIADDSPARGYLISTTFFVSGIATILQVTIGSRLPIIQGNSFAFLLPTLAILNMPGMKCPEQTGSSYNGASLQINNTDSDVLFNEIPLEDESEIWKIRIREIQGAIIVASVVELFLGLTGLVGYLMKFVTPVTIAPVIALIGLSLFEEAGETASANWLISIGTMAILIILSQYCDEILVPSPTFSKQKGWRTKKIPLFKLIPVLLTVIVAWLLCFILTQSGAFSDGNAARTDLRNTVFNESPWFSIPWPGQFGSPTFTVAAVCGMLCGVFSSVIESVGDYYACAKLSGAPPPPTHAVNRGIALEGIGCLLAGIFGSGSALTSYSQNIGAIGVTKVGSRRVVVWAGFIMIVLSVFSKFGALFIIMPDPVLGGIFPFMFAMISGVGLSALHYVNLNSTRNVFVVGASLFLGLMVPTYLKNHPGCVQTGSDFLDQLLTILLSTGIFVGGVVGIFLDNTIRGTDDERGILKWRESETECSNSPLSVNDDGTNGKDAQSQAQGVCYDLPFGMEIIRSIPMFKRIPISPTYKMTLSSTSETNME